MANKQSILASYIKETTDLSSVITFYRREGQVRDLIRLADDPDYTTTALYVLSEIGSAARPVWKETIKFVGHSEPEAAYWILDLVHAYAEEHDADELLTVFRAVDLNNDPLFAKCFSILLSKRKEVWQALWARASQDDIYRTYAQGLWLSLNCECVTPDRLIGMLRQESKLVQLFACCAIARCFPSDAFLTDLLPPLVREDIRMMGPR